MISRRTVLQGLGALATLPITSVFGKTEENYPVLSNPHGEFLEDFIGEETDHVLVDILPHSLGLRRWLDEASLARRLLLQQVGEKGWDHQSYDAHSNHYVSGPIRYAESDDLEEVYQHFLAYEEKAFGALLRKAFRETWYCKNSSLECLDGVRLAIEKRYEVNHMLPFDTMLVCWDDVKALEGRWERSYYYDKVDVPEVRETGFLGSILGMSIISREGSPSIQSGEAFLLTRPDYLGRFQDRGISSETFSDREVVKNDFSMGINFNGAERLVFVDF